MMGNEYFYRYPFEGINLQGTKCPSLCPGQHDKIYWFITVLYYPTTQVVNLQYSLRVPKNCILHFSRQMSQFGFNVCVIQKKIPSTILAFIGQFLNECREIYTLSSSYMSGISRTMLVKQCFRYLLNLLLISKRLFYLL